MRELPLARHCTAGRLSRLALVSVGLTLSAWMLAPAGVGFAASTQGKHLAVGHQATSTAGNQQAATTVGHQQKTASATTSHSTNAKPGWMRNGKFGDTSKPQPLSGADQNSGGANGQCPGGKYCSTRNGAPSKNGNGNGQATGRPCAGCVGRADNKNPPGLLGNTNSHGYECNTNHGIGRTNPAHTGCRKPPPPPPCTHNCHKPPPPPCKHNCHKPPPPPPCTHNCTHPGVHSKVVTQVASFVVQRGGGTLPFTGAPIASAVELGGLALAAGATLGWAARRRDHGAA